MKFYDMHLHSAFSEGESSIEQIALRAKELGYSGICFSEYFENKSQIDKLKHDISKVKEKVGIDIFLGFEARTTQELKKLVTIRKMYDILLARGGDLKMNRDAVETKEVDILTHPEHKRYDSGINHVMAKLAKKNDVAVEINFREILTSNKKTRSMILSNMMENVRLAKKYSVPVVICSGSISHWELRDPLSMVSMLNTFGMKLKDSKASISKVPESIINETKKRKDVKWIMPGVRKR